MKTRPHSPAGLPPSRPLLPAQQACGASHHPNRARQRQRGLSLLELLIALLLGLVLLGAVSTAYLANRQTFRQVENLARVNENARTTFELLGRELREAGGTHCGARVPTANVVRAAVNPPWWSDWGRGLQGYESNQELPAALPQIDNTSNPAAGRRVPGTDALIIWSGSVLPPVSIVVHNPPAASLQVVNANHGLNDGDIVMACDMAQAAIFQISNSNQANSTIVHNTGAAVQPGNCRKELGLSPAPPHDCSTAGSDHSFAGGGFLGRLSASAWYIGFNGRGGTSLYRSALSSTNGVAGAAPEEVIENVTDLELQYLEPNAAGALPAAYVDANLVTDWNRVQAVRLEPTFVTAERVGTDGNPINRPLPFVVGIRTRLP